MLCVVLQQFVPKRGGEEERDAYGEPPPKQQQSKGPGEGLTKFSVEIVQQLEFTTSANNSQISTNVTVKALNTSVKSDLSTSSTASPAPPPQQPPPAPPPPHVVKQEQEDPEFVDLEQCAAALEKDAAANGGHSFPGFSDLIGDETSDAIMASEAFKDLFSEISDFHPGFLKDFDFDAGDSKHHESQQHQHHVFKTEEDSKSNVQQQQQQQQQQQRVNVQQQQRMYSSSMDFSKAELSPAAQTLKQMAEQHQHKSQLGMSFSAPGNPYPELINSPPQQNIKQEVNSPRLQYSPYGSPGHAHGSPQYTPRPPGQPPQAPQRPPSHPGATTLQINQAQQLHISQAQGQPPIQVSQASCTFFYNSILNGSLKLGSKVDPFGSP